MEEAQEAQKATRDSIKNSNSDNSQRPSQTKPADTQKNIYSSDTNSSTTNGKNASNQALNTKQIAEERLAKALALARAKRAKGSNNSLKDRNTLPMLGVAQLGVDKRKEKKAFWSNLGIDKPTDTSQEAHLIIVIQETPLIKITVIYFLFTC